METRILRGDEQKATFELFAQAFEHGSRDPKEFDQWWKYFSADWNTVGVYNESGLQACVLITSYQAHFGPGVVLPLGGVDGVATLPAARGKNYAGAGLKRALEEMRDAGQIVSMLNPFDFYFYRKFGWEWVGRRRKYEAQTRVLKPDRETEYVRAARPEDRAAIVSVYTRYAARYRGMLKRSEKHWREILDDRPDKFTYTYLYERGGEPQGYLTFRGGKQKETWIREFITLTPAAQRGLLGLLRRHEMQTDKFTWNAPENDILWSNLMTKGIETKLWPLYMGRVVNAPEALQAWKPQPGGAESPMRGTVVLAITDEYAPWNAGTWRLTVEDGESQMNRMNAAPQISLDIQALSQAFFGTPALAELRAANRIAVSDENGYTVLNALLSGPPMYTNDSF